MIEMGLERKLMANHGGTQRENAPSESTIKQLAAQLRAAETELAAARAVQQMALRAVGATHDLSNLLTIMLGHLLLITEQAPPETQELLNPVRHAAEDGQALIRRVLSRTLVQSPATETGVSTVIYEALTLTRPMWLRIADLTIDAVLTPTPALAADPLIVRQVLINLLLNAFNVMPNGGTLTIRSDIVGSSVTIDIKDTGPGLMPDVQATLFEPFTTGHLEGHGLGLATSRALIVDAGGSLNAVSIPGQGTTFTITLPAVS